MKFNTWIISIVIIEVINLMKHEYSKLGYLLFKTTLHHTTQHMIGKRDQQHIHTATKNLPIIPKKNAKLSELVRKFLKKRPKRKA